MAFAERDNRTKKLTGRWMVDFIYKPQGEPERRMKRAFETKAKAEANETYARSTGIWADPDSDVPVGPTFKAAAEAMREVHEPWKKGRDPSGQKRLDWVIGKIGHKPVAHVSTDDLDNLVRDLRARPVSNKRNKSGHMTGRTLNGYLTMASAVLTWAAERPKVYGAFKTPVIPWQPVVQTRIHFLTQDQLRLIVRHYLDLGYVDEDVVLRVLAASGMRWSEFEGLEPHMVTVTTRANGAQVGWIKLDETKTDTPRDIPVTPAMATELRALLQNGYRPNYNRSRTRFDAAKKVLGLNPALTMYGARHGAATYLTKNGMAPAKIQQFMGHKTYRTTERYVHVESEDLAEAVDFLNPTLGGEASSDAPSTVVPLRKVV